MPPREETLRVVTLRRCAPRMLGRRRFGQWLIRTNYLPARMRRRRPRSPRWRSAHPRSARSTRTGSATSGRRWRSTSRPTAAASRRSIRAPSPGMVWIFAHRFHAEFSVARLLAPFLLAAPTYDVQLLLATQVADEHRHLQAVLRIYEEVFGVRGGIDAVREVADRNMDLVAEALYARLEHHVGRLSATSDEDDFLAAVVVYHLLAEGVIARTAQNLAATQYERLVVPGARRGPAPGRARRGAAHRHRRLVRPPAHGAGSRADDRRDHARDGGAARAVVGAARPRRRGARRPRPLGLRHRPDRLLLGGPAAGRSAARRRWATRRAFGD